MMQGIAAGQAWILSIIAPFPSAAALGIPKDRSRLDVMVWVSGGVDGWVERGIADAPVNWKEFCGPSNDERRVFTQVRWVVGAESGTGALIDATFGGSCPRRAVPGGGFAGFVHREDSSLGGSELLVVQASS